MTTPSITLPTDGQLKQVRRFAEDAIDRAIKESNLTKDQIQSLIEKGGSFQGDIADSIWRLTSPRTFAFEEAECNYGYSAYHKPRKITEQIKILQQFFPAISRADAGWMGFSQHSASEGWFVIPKWQIVAETYGEAVRKVLELIKMTRDGKFYNFREGQFDHKYLCASVKTIQAFEKIEEGQKGHDILMIPAQFGLRHGGRSVRRALEVMSANEFGLGAFAVGIMLLTHPERFEGHDDLWIDCAGDEFSLGSEDMGKFQGNPYFGYEGGQVCFGAGFVGDAKGNYGSASGFLPQG